jgi:uncharacterized protein (DUF924 family)
MIDHRARDVLDFWFGAGPQRGKRHKRWFEKDAAFDAEVATRYAGLVDALAQSEAWLEEPASCLARIVALDQFPRHIFRGNARAFATDSLALSAARHALAKGYDRGMLPVERLFTYLPFEHSEALEDQRLACELCRPLEGFEETADTFRYALAHHAIIERFGRFPHRNAALGRESTAEEMAFLKEPGSSF